MVHCSKNVAAIVVLILRHLYTHMHTHTCKSTEIARLYNAAKFIKKTTKLYPFLLFLLFKNFFFVFQKDLHSFLSLSLSLSVLLFFTFIFCTKFIVFYALFKASICCCIFFVVIFKRALFNCKRKRKKIFKIFIFIFYFAKFLFKN